MYTINAKLVIETRLKEFGWNQSDLSEASGVSPATVSNLEAGLRISPKSLRQIAKALKLKLKYLYIIEDDHAAVAK